MRSQQQFHFLRQPYPHARAVARVQEQDQYKVTMMVAYALASAIIVLWMAYFPSLIGTALTNLNVLPVHLSSAAENTNGADKDDQLARVQFDDRWGALATMMLRTLGENDVRVGATGSATDIQRFPAGCESAFSQLVKTKTFSGRCVASANIPAPLVKIE